MKRLIPVFMFLFASLVFSQTFQKKLSFDLKKLSSIDRVSLEFVNGTAKVKGVNGKFVKVKGTLKVKGADQSVCEEVLKKAILKTKINGNELELSLNYDDLKKYLNNNVGFFNFFCSPGKHVELSVELEVQIPKNFDVDFSGVNFDLHLDSVRSGDLSNVNGNIFASNVGRVECETVNGNITLKDIVYKVDCEVVNGNLKLTTKSSKISSISFESVNGNAEIKLPYSSIGNIETQSLTSKTTLVLQGKKMIKKDLEWKGNGNCDIDIETINGKIIVEGF